MPGLKTSFVAAALVGAAAVAGFFALNSPAHPAVSGARQLASEVWVSEQVKPDRLRSLHAAGFRSLVDLRPDGEAPDQPSAREMASAAAEAGLQFAYVPVPHGDLPADSVDALAQSLKRMPAPVLLYCRSGRRAARTWALAEASNPAGPGAAEIETQVRRAGQDADDLHQAIAARVAARGAMR